MSKNWIAVASANHVRKGRMQGFMQVSHGKGAPLKRISPGDLVAYYSPTLVYGEKEPCRAFTAFGRVKDRAPYQGDMGGGFTLWRRDVAWLGKTEAPIAPLLEPMEFTQGRTNWGYKFRFGLFEVSDHDMAVIAAAVGAAS
jgi:EVE domain